MQSLHDLPPLDPGINLDKISEDAAKLQAKHEAQAPKPEGATLEIDNQLGQELEAVDSASGVTQEIQETLPEPQPEKPQARNFKELKQQMLRLQRERDAMARQLEAQEEAKGARFTPTQAAEPDPEIPHFKDDEYIEAKHVNQLAQQLKNVKNQLKQYQNQSIASLAEQRLRLEFPDFDKVFTPENCSTLAMLDPDLALSIDADKDTYRKAKLAYKSIKTMGISSDEAYQDDKEKIQKNASKPRMGIPNATTAGASPLTRAGSFEKGLTKELQQQLYREMIEARKGM